MFWKSRGLDPAGAAALSLKWQKWPEPRDFDRFFGAIEWGADGEPTERWERRSLIRLPMPFTLRLGWAPERTARSFRCARPVRHSVARIFSAIWEHYGRDPAAVTAAEVDLFWGCYFPSDGVKEGQLTAYGRGAAIRLGRKLPEFVMAVFVAEGWREWNGVFVASA